jgi:DNA-binding transcriptional LysR family regulator
MMLDCLNRFGTESPQTRIELYETVRDGTTEALLSGNVDLAISGVVPPQFSGESLLPVRFVFVAHPDHPLHHLGRDIDVRDLRKHRHLVVRDTSSYRDKRASIEVEQRWTVTNMSTSIGAACRGFGFAWFPEDKIRTEIDQGILKPLPLRDGGERVVQIYLIFRDRDAAGPGTLRLAQIIREEVAGLVQAYKAGNKLNR